MSQPDILVMGPMMTTIIDQLGAQARLHRLWEAPDQPAFLAQVGPSIRGIVAAGGRAPVDEAVFQALPGAEIVANFGVGYDNVDAAAAARRGVVVTNTPDVLTEEVADLAVGLLLATVRRLPAADRFIREGGWLAGAFPFTPTLRGRTVGILGLGRIGQAIARRLEAFGLAIAYCGRSRQPGVRYAYHATPVELAAACDVLIVVTPGGGETAKLVDARVLEALGPEGFLVNVARGSVVDEDALVAALRSGAIAGAGLDVFADEPRVPAALIACENAVLLPHVGSATHATRGAMAQLVVDNLLSWFAGKGPLTPVKETPWPRG